MTSNAPIKTKLHPPVIGRDIVARPRLHNRLDYHRPLTLVVAPAGYGKTTLVVDWLEHSRYPSAWVSLDIYDDSLSAFMTYFLAALEMCFPGACPETRAILNSVTLPSPAVVAHTLVNELEELPHGIVLVLDDYHVINDVAVHELMAELLTYQPQLLELVLIARHDPPLPLAGLRAHNQVTEIRANELRFSSEESSSFLQEVNALPIDNVQTALLEEMTEGWATGMRLAALLLQQSENGTAATLNLNGSGRLALDYLANEVLARQTPEVQEFLQKTAFMEQVCAPLCAAVVAGGATAEQCQAHLEALAGNNLFVFALDDEGAWYRYHHLLRSVLKNRAGRALSAAELAVLHTRASAWLAAHGFIDAAITHAVQAGDVQAVADLVRAHRQQLMDSSTWSGLETWRRLIPRAMIEAHPQLLVLDAWSFSHRALTADCGRCVDAIESLLAAAPLPADEERLLRSELDALRSQSIYWTGDVESCLEAGRRALAAAPHEYAYTRALTWLFYILCLEMAGRAEAASAALDDALREGDLWRGGPYQALVFVAAGFLHWGRADMIGMDDYANRMLALAQERNLYEAGTYAHYFRGCARYQRNDLAGAEQDFAAVLQLAHISHPFIHSQSVIGLAATYQARGEFDKARDTAARGWQHVRESGTEIMAARLEGFGAHLAFRQGKMDEALRWLAQPSPILAAGPMPTFHFAPLGRAAILLGEGSVEARAEAVELLALLRANAESRHYTRFLIDVLALEALALAADGQQEAALDLLERAVLLTVPGESVRALADYYDQIGSLLEQLAPRSAARSQIALIRRAALVGLPAVQADAGQEPKPAAPVASVYRGEHGDLMEILTHREMDVLTLLLERPSNKEIAQQLNVSTDTVKRHLSNIFLKLHVENRRQAILQARRMGIQPPP